MDQQAILVTDILTCHSGKASVTKDITDGCFNLVSQQASMWNNRAMVSLIPDL